MSDNQISHFKRWAFHSAFKMWLIYTCLFCLLPQSRKSHSQFTICSLIPIPQKYMCTQSRIFSQISCMYLNLTPVPTNNQIMSPPIPNLCFFNPQHRFPLSLIPTSTSNQVYSNSCFPNPQSMYSQYAYCVFPSLSLT